jgi:alpha-glucosidase (family GH31 glycosyl hydrolase)
MYSLFVANNDEELGFASGTIMRPLWWNYPTDEEAYKFEDREFMLGEDILVAPVLE